LNDHRELWWPAAAAARVQVAHLELEEPFQTVHGEQFAELQVAFESWGELNENRDNAVLVIHPLTSDTHATGDFDGQPPGWWESLIGPGRAIDTDSRFVICPNLTGSCYGSTGPRFPAPDGEPYLDRFPLLTPLDITNIQHLLIQQLGITRLRMVIGPSMGGMIAWEWAIEHGEAVDQVVVVAAPLKTTPYQIGLNWLQRRGIEIDVSGDEITSRLGQMVARGVGMLSYRAPIGVEEKFGRDWFKKPGGTIKNRGMFNIESWLRHHGKRITKRFDPLTYILLTRSMDLHDVGENRGGLISALDQVECPVLAIGISSDQLYSSAEVHLGAEILQHLEKPVRFAEIRSPHGHDGFLLETDQVASILRDSPAPGQVLVPTRDETDLRLVRLGILGAGRVAEKLARVLEGRTPQLHREHRLRVVIGAVAETDPARQLSPVFGKVDFLRNPEELVRREDLDVILDLTRGQGSLALVEEALTRGRPVVTPNKTLLHAHGPRLERLALDHGVRLAYHNSIAAGWPLLYSVDRPLGRRDIRSLQAVLSSTCNFILEAVEGSDTFDDALAAAVTRGLTEPDPQLDLSGWDTMQKLMILVARTLGVRYGQEAIPTSSITGLTPALIQGAPALGLRVKQIGLYMEPVNRQGDAPPVLGVLPMAVPLDGYLGGSRDDNNVLVVDGGEEGELAYFARGGGDVPVASAVLGDLVGLFEPARSWTGRYPPATRTPAPPRFARFLQIADGEVRVAEENTAGSIPVLSSLLHSR
jgi:homoserine O-acetyltransferase